MRAESWTMWVIVSSWRLRGYCRRKWPSLIQVALSIPLPDPRLALPRRSLALRPLFLSLSLSSLPTSSPPSPPSALFAPSNQSFRLAFPSFIHDARYVALFSSPPFLHEEYILSFGRSFLSLWKGGRGWKHFSPLFHPFFPLRFSIFFFFEFLFEFELFPDESFVWEKKEGVVRRWKFYFALLHRDHVFSAGVRQVRVERTQHLDGWI